MAAPFLSEKTSKQIPQVHIMQQWAWLVLFCQKRQASRTPWPGWFFFVRKDKQALFKDLGPSFFKLGPRTLVKGQKSRGF